MGRFGDDPITAPDAAKPQDVHCRAAATSTTASSTAPASITLTKSPRRHEAHEELYFF
jgi:hypothetical protein